MNCQNEDLQTYYQQARAFAYKNGLRDHAGDFASYVLVQKLSNSNRKIRFETILVDYKRKTFGDSRTGVGAKKASNIRFEDTEDPGQTFVYCHENHSKTQWVEIPQRCGFNLDERITFILIVLYGFSFEEIALVLGTSEKRVQGYFTGILFKAKGIKE